MINENASAEAKARYARFWGGGLPELPEQRAARLAAARQARYDAPQYGGLTGYQSKDADKLDRQPGESTEAWRRRVLRVARHLPEEEVEARLAAIDQAEQPPTFEALREQLDQRTSGTGVGIMGASSPTQRAAAYHASLNRRGRDGSALTYQPDATTRPASMAEINAIIAEREAARRGQQPQRVDVSSMRSSGSEFLGVDRG